MTEVHTDWTTPGFSRDPVASAIGAFARRPFLEAWWDVRRAPGDELLLVEDTDAMLSLYRRGAVIEFLGESDLTDYHSPLGQGVADVVAAFVGSLPPGQGLHFDSLPWEAADPIVKGLRSVGCSAEPEQHTIAAVLDLPASFDAYLDGLDKKHRHELRRKRRRFELTMGGARLEETTSPEGLSEFVRLHRMALGEKGDFFTPDIEAWFLRLLDLPDVRLDLLFGAEGRAVAGGFGFEDDDGYYLYNSAYDTTLGEASPGIVLLWALIESAIDRGRPRFDFLKGDEQYKYRLGASPRPLYRIEATT